VGSSIAVCIGQARLSNHIVLYAASSIAVFAYLSKHIFGGVVEVDVLVIDFEVESYNSPSVE
jgi:hypothetical protein